MMTMGQAVDTAIKTHESAYPGSEVYQVDVHVSVRFDLRGSYCVELRATHFSVPLVHYVPIA